MHLKAKYTKTSESTASTYMSKTQSFPDYYNVEEHGIDNAWETLKLYRRKLSAADALLKTTYPDKGLFHLLTKALSDKYNSILDGLRTNPQTSIEERLHILQEKEEDSKVRSIQAHPAKGKLRHFSTRRGSDVSMTDVQANMLCYRCDGEDHVSRDCPYAEAIKDYAIALRKREEGSRQKYRSPQKRRDGSRYRDKQSLKTNPPRKSDKTSHGYAARKNASDTSTYDSCDEE
ncbi:hypothetical protein OnM2_076059 [Erysiphe neolycopersici]|uniref:CCHC-type domain-containing protein n=1 Tax=Erysiphe neolycopersici TaxID=212602 RepID=A0A420HIB0_9PEZI|nr:hypothetical protein OnM2_076059 [Erysiphe neolycopersici]